MSKYLGYNSLIRYGLGIIFIANALAAFFAPDELIEIIKNSFVASLLPVSPRVFVGVVIGLNDSIVGLLLISGFATRRVALWATMWIVGVIIIIAKPLDMLEHSGLLFMSAALVLGDTYPAAKKLYQCSECGLSYEDKIWKDKCEAWCKKHHTCHVEITRRAVKNKS